MYGLKVSSIQGVAILTENCGLFQLLERPNDWGLDVFQLAEVVSPSRALGVLGFTLFKVG